MNVRKSVDLANQIRRDILAGKYGTEGGLPETRELAKRHNVAVNTVVAALANLEGQGLIEKRGHSFYVASLSFTMTHYIPPVHLRQSQYAKNIGKIERVPLPDYIVSKLNLSDVPETVLRMQVSGEINGSGTEKPYMLAYQYYMMPVTDEQIRRMQDDTSYDVKFSATPVEMRCHDEIAPRQLTQEESQHLNVPQETPVNTLFVTIRDTEDTLWLIQELVLSPRVTLVYNYTFENRPA